MAVLIDDARLEVDLEQPDARNRLRFDALDTIHRGREVALAQEHDSALHVLRGKPWVSPHHGHNRDVYDGEDVHGHALDGQPTHEQQDKRKDGDRVRLPQRESD